MYGSAWHVANHLFQRAANQANVTFADAFPIGFQLIVGRLAKEVLLPLQTEIYVLIIESGIVYNDVFFAVYRYSAPGLDPSNGSPLFLKQKVGNRYLQLYRSIFSECLIDDYNSRQIMNMTFQEFADQAYVDFDMEAIYYEVQAYFFQKWYDDLIELGHTIYTDTDLYDLTTTWLR